MIKGVHHIALKCHGVESFNKTIEFYRDVLGLQVVRTWGAGNDSGIMLTTGDAMLEIFANADDEPIGGAIRHFALATDDVDECVRAVEAAGYGASVPGAAAKQQPGERHCNRFRSRLSRAHRLLPRPRKRRNRIF